ncbi:hypothetical protein [Thermoflexus sp.]|uniref:hypothetical protein n=1 Tax=Thermoflexus sp. TaxID=1969742 RepID=UPI0035E44F7F
MWNLTLSDRSFPGVPPEAIFERAGRTGIPKLLVHDESLRPIRKRRLGLLRSRDMEDWRGVSQRAEELDYSRPRLHALRFERLRAGVRLTGWAIAPRSPHLGDASRVRQYVLTAAAATAFLGARGLLLEGIDQWELNEAVSFIRHLLPALGGLHLTLWLRLSATSPFLSELPRKFVAAIRPWIALDLEDALPEDFRSLWAAVSASTSMVLFRYEPEFLDWWDREGRPLLKRTEFAGELVVTFPEIWGKDWRVWKQWVQEHGLLS